MRLAAINPGFETFEHVIHDQCTIDGPFLSIFVPSLAPRKCIKRPLQPPASVGHRQLDWSDCMSTTPWLNANPSNRRPTLLPLLLLLPSVPRSRPRPRPRSRFQILNPYPAIQSLYLATNPLQSSCGSSALENNIHSSRCAFSSLHTQHGLTFSFSFSLTSDARFVGVDGCVTAAGCAGVGVGEDEELNQPIVSVYGYESKCGSDG